VILPSIPPRSVSPLVLTRIRRSPCIRQPASHKDRYGSVASQSVSQSNTTQPWLASSSEAKRSEANRRNCNALRRRSCAPAILSCARLGTSKRTKKGSLHQQCQASSHPKTVPVSLDMDRSPVGRSPQSPVTSILFVIRLRIRGPQSCHP